CRRLADDTSGRAARISRHRVEASPIGRNHGRFNIQCSAVRVLALSGQGVGLGTSSVSQQDFLLCAKWQVWRHSVWLAADTRRLLPKSDVPKARTMGDAEEAYRIPESRGRT